MIDQIYDNELHMMEVQGGSFIKSLAHCYYMADPTNRVILKKAFASYFDSYQVRFDNWRVNIKPREHCQDHQRYASDCGACYHANVDPKATGAQS